MDLFKRASRALITFLGSFGLSCIVLVLLLVLVFFGTLEQVNQGLYDVQKKYFESVFLVHEVGGIPIPLPGAYLLIAVLMVNLVVGGILRMRKTWSRAGIFIAHLGIALLLAGSYATFEYSVDGHLTLYENEHSAQFVSYHDWEVAISEVRAQERTEEYVIPVSELSKAETNRFHHEDLPFEVALSAYERHCRPKPAANASLQAAFDGFLLEKLPLRKSAEQNVPGARILLREKEGGAIHESLLWGQQRFPWVAEASGRKWAVDLRKRRYDLPFTIVLDKFTRELHPRTGIPRVFLSDVTKIEHGVSQSLKITMNEPLREKGYTLYQSSWGPGDAAPGDPLYSTLAVVSNPADQLPLYACIVISLGLVFHFSRSLARYLKFEAKRKP